VTRLVCTAMMSGRPTVLRALGDRMVEVLLQDPPVMMRAVSTTQKNAQNID